MTDTPETTEARGTRKELVGTVLSNAMDKTIVVQTERLSRHPIFKKTVRVRK